MIYRCFDYRKVKRLAKGFTPVISRDIIYLVEHGPRGDEGMWTVHQMLQCTPKTYLMHADIREPFRGKPALKSLKETINWIFKNTPANKIVAGIPKNNRAACVMAVRGGFRYRVNFGQKRYYEVIDHAKRVRERECGQISPSNPGSKPESGRRIKAAIR